MQALAVFCYSRFVHNMELKYKRVSFRKDLCFIIKTMKNKYKSVGLDYDLIIDKFKNIYDYEETANAYLSDEFFRQLEDMLDEEDYAMAKDATKGLYILASELCMFPLYESLLEVYEDLEYEMYSDVMGHYKDMYRVYEKIRSVFHA